MTNAANLSSLGSEVSSSGIIAASAMPTGSVIQVVQYIPPASAISPGTAGSNSATLTTSNTNLAFSATITPQFSTSRILLMFHSSTDNTYSSGEEEYEAIFRGNTCLATSLWYRRVSGDEPQTHVINYLDSPGTTSSVQYDLRVATSNGSGTMYFNRDAGGNTNNSWALSTTWILQEIR